MTTDKDFESALKPYYAEFLKRIRVEHCLSQEEMADALQISTRSYINLEHGKSLFKARTLFKLVFSFNLDANELIYGAKRFFDEEK